MACQGSLPGNIWLIYRSSCLVLSLQVLFGEREGGREREYKDFIVDHSIVLGSRDANKSTSRSMSSLINIELNLIFSSSSFKIVSSLSSSSSSNSKKLSQHSTRLGQISTWFYSFATLLGRVGCKKRWIFCLILWLYGKELPKIVVYQ